MIVIKRVVFMLLLNERKKIISIGCCKLSVVACSEMQGEHVHVMHVSESIRTFEDHKNTALKLATFLLMTFIAAKPLCVSIINQRMGGEHKLIDSQVCKLGLSALLV